MGTSAIGCNPRGLRAMSFLRVIILSVGLWTAADCSGQHGSSAQPEQSLCKMSDPHCGLRGIDPKITSSAIASEIFQRGSDYYFPVSILTASFGLEPRDYAALRYPHRLTRHQFALLLSQEKRFVVSDPSKLPALVALDLGQGPKVYDADLLRDLFATELFPYRMRIVSLKAPGGNGIRLDEVRLDRRAAKVASACLKDIDQINNNVSDCSDAFKLFESKKDTKGESTASSIFKWHFLANSFGFFAKPLGYLPSMGENNTDNSPDSTSACGENKKSYLERAIACLPVKNTNPVWLQADWKDPKEIGPLALEMLTPAEQKDLPEKSAVQFYRFEFDLHLPRWSSSTYGSIKVSIESPKDSDQGLAIRWVCAPPGLEQKPVTETMGPLGNPCTSQASWVFSGAILRPDDELKQPLELLVPAVPSKETGSTPNADSIHLKITLTGTPILGPLAPLFGQTQNSVCWDVPSGLPCPKAQGSR